MKFDGHIHSPYCPHGSQDTFEEYIQSALAHGFREISFTEHAPLPEGFNDPTPDKDSGMNRVHLEAYIEELEMLKQKYKNKLKINIGLEIDYIVDFEQETTDFLNKFGRFLDDSILSVHFLKLENQYFCLDFSDEEFEKIISLFGSTERVYQEYYKLVKRSVEADLGIYKPKRIGHMTLVRKFQKKFPCSNSFKEDIFAILDLICEKKMSLDYNGAGAIKPLCLEPYPPNWIATEAAKRSIPLVYGSDAHSVKGLKQGFNKLSTSIILSSPTGF
ncbi:histidinol-phosphatase HisJ [Calidifontibacillus oryziterrae]|uniref:histidinol-phosphatase HisJ n=1 Tax=Calidifontibacillus oryziterrae TaxID=1191699 RepID=UPI0002E68F8E|nr:histidinol-phosphatase HisJ [Calidifontibacillus oryziterrae]